VTEFLLLPLLPFFVAEGVQQLPSVAVECMLVMYSDA